MTELRAAEIRLAVTYAPQNARGAVGALFALDDALGNLLRSAREPMLAQMRLTWWHAQLEALDTAAPPAVPELRALADHVVGDAVTGANLARMVEGWEALIDDPPLDAAALTVHSDRRGGGLFAAIAACCGYGGDGVEDAGRGWALVDLAVHLGDAGKAEAARALAGPLLDSATRRHWGRKGRMLGALAHMARIDAAAKVPQEPGSPRRVARMAWHALSGR